MIGWMSRSEWFRPGSSPRRTRLLMTGAFVGALLVLALSVMFSWPVEVNNPIAAVDKEAERADKAFNSPAGSCLTWTKADASDMREVRCEQPHLFEMIGVLDISKQLGPQAPFPGMQQWREFTEERCTPKVNDYLGKKFDPHGKLSVSTLRPTEEQWAEGDRKLRCGLKRTSPGGELQELTVPAAEENQSDVYQPGTCLALAGNTVGDPIDCEKAHAFEMASVVDLGKKFTEGFPSEGDQNSFLDRECSKRVDEYSGSKDLKENSLVLTWDTRTKESWEAGSKLVNCKIAAKPKDKTSLAPVTGSFQKAPPTSSKPPKKSTGGK
ncbi:MAG: hypothetical protein GEU98_05595 [Pseudonocardiaceae bacterium]|nr:hypothetical protein [Pseudonocardiaceae bacterium]